MEIPDVIVVNKADHPLTDTMVREIKTVLALGPHRDWEVPIIRTEAARGEGVQELADALAEHRDHIEAEGTLSERRRRNLMNEVLAIATFRMRRELEESIREDDEVRELLDRVVARELDPASAATTILEREPSLMGGALTMPLLRGGPGAVRRRAWPSSALRRRGRAGRRAAGGGSSRLSPPVSSPSARWALVAGGPGRLVADGRALRRLCGRSRCASPGRGAAAAASARSRPRLAAAVAAQRRAGGGLRCWPRSPAPGRWTGSSIARRGSRPSWDWAPRGRCTGSCSPTPSCRCCGGPGARR